MIFFFFKWNINLAFLLKDGYFFSFQSGFLYCLVSVIMILEVLKEMYNNLKHGSNSDN